MAVQSQRWAPDTTRMPLSVIRGALGDNKVVDETALSRLSAAERRRMYRVAVELLKRRAATSPSHLYEWLTGLPPSPYHEQIQKFIDEHDACAIVAPPEAGKSTQVSITRCLWEIGQNQEVRIGLVGAKEDQAKNFIMAQLQFLRSPRYHEIFPSVELDAAEITKTQYRVKRRSVLPEPTVWGVGLFGAFLSARLDRIFVDDFLTFTNTLTSAQRDKIYRWIMSSECMGRLMPGGKIAILGNAWNGDDAIHRLERDGWPVLRLPVTDVEPSRPEDITMTTMPTVWPVARLQERARLISRQEFARQFLCKARADEDMTFKPEWFDKAIKLGIGLEMHDHIPKHEAGIVTVGVDLGVSEREEAAETVLYALWVGVDGFRRPLRLLAGRWRASIIIEHIQEFVLVYPGAWWRVENNAAQEYIVQWAQDMLKMNVTGRQTTRLTKALGFSSLAADLENGRYRIPSGADGQTVDIEVQHWIGELMDYSPSKHPGDRAMAGMLANEEANERLQYLCPIDEYEAPSVPGIFRL